MCSIILILQLSLLLLTSGFTEQSELDLNCLNDYETEMMCSLPLAEASFCSEYKLNVSIEKIKDVPYSCTFEASDPSTCWCTMKAQFNVGEIFKVNVLRGGSILGTKEIHIVDTIKPKQPIITSVNQTERGNFIITLNTNYPEVMKSFRESLRPELSYRAEGNPDWTTKILERGCTSDEMVRSNLQPNTKYVMRVRVKSEYSNNSTYSDYSEPYYFTTTSPPMNILIIIIPILCVITTVCIITIYYWYNKILKLWWVKIPTPKIATNFVKQVEQLLSFQNEFATVCVEPLNLDHIGKATRIAPSEGTTCRPGLEEHGVSPKVLYTQTGYESVQKSQQELHEEHQSGNMDKTDYGNLQANSGSSFNNKLYLSSRSNCSCPSSEVSQQTPYFYEEKVFPKTPNPVIPTDFDYGTCNAFDSTGPLLFSEMVLVPGYQSFGEIMGKQEVSLTECSIIPLVDGYQDF